MSLSFGLAKIEMENRLPETVGMRLHHFLRLPLETFCSTSNRLGLTFQSVYHLYEELIQITSHL